MMAKLGITIRVDKAWQAAYRAADADTRARMAREGLPMRLCVDGEGSTLDLGHVGALTAADLNLESGDVPASGALEPETVSNLVAAQAG